MSSSVHDWSVEPILLKAPSGNFDLIKKTGFSDGLTSGIKTPTTFFPLTV
jgi:hypothetical protein